MLARMRRGVTPRNEPGAEPVDPVSPRIDAVRRSVDLAGTPNNKSTENGVATATAGDVGPTLSARSRRASEPAILALPKGQERAGSATPPSLARATSCQEGAAPSSLAFRVVVRCRPVAASDAATFSLAPESFGLGKVSVKLKAPESGGGEELRRYHAVGPRTFRCNAYFGPDASQQSIFDHAADVASSTMEGSNGAVLCCGATGSGKTYTMVGPSEEVGRSQGVTNASGLIPRISRNVFEYVRDRSGDGQTFAVEASFLEICLRDDREQLIDLLSEEDNTRLELKQERVDQRSFTCEGLTRVPIRTPEEMCEQLRVGRRRCAFLEKQRRLPSSRAHCVFILTVESFTEQAGASEPICRRGKLMLVDLAGSSRDGDRSMSKDGGSAEPLQKQPADRLSLFARAVVHERAERRAKEEVPASQCAQGQQEMPNELLSTLGRGQLGVAPDSSLALLLRDCLGGGARGLLIAHVCPELEQLEDAAKTMSFAQQMVSVRSSSVHVNRVEQDQSMLLDMRQRHADCLRLLQEKVVDQHDEELEERARLQEEMDDLNKRLLTRESAEQKLEEMRSEQLRKIDDLRTQMTQAIRTEFDQVRQQSLQELGAKVDSLQAELQEAVAALGASEKEAADLRERLAAAEERSKLLQERREETDDLNKRFDIMRQQYIQDLGELRQTFENHVTSAVVERSAKHAEEHGVRADKLQAELLGAVKAQRSAEMETAELRALLTGAEERAKMLQVERDAGLQRDALHAQELKRCKEEHEEAKAREAELMHMLNEVQDSIITASSTGAAPPPG